MSNNKFHAAIEKLKKRAGELKENIYLLYLIFKHTETPWYAKVLAISTVCYALSPIDLIPDFIPVIGYLDDLLIIPLGIMLSLKLVPKEIIDECKENTSNEKDIKKFGIYAAIIIVLIWAYIIYIILKKTLLKKFFI